MMTFQVRYKICCLKTWRLFSSSWNPCWTCVANSNGIVLLCHREKLLVRRSHVPKLWRNECDTSWESLQFKAEVTCIRKSDESQINQTDWLIYQQAYFIGSRFLISFIYRSNKNGNFHPNRSTIYLSDKYCASLHTNPTPKKLGNCTNCE